jgi:hypothetical protein
MPCCAMTSAAAANRLRSGSSRRSTCVLRALVGETMATCYTINQ